VRSKCPAQNLPVVGKNCGLEQYSRPRAQVFPIRTDQDRQITCLCFFLYSIALKATFVMNFNSICSVQIWRAFDISGTKSDNDCLHNCSDSVLNVYILRCFTLYQHKAWKVAKVRNFVAVRTRGLDGKNPKPLESARLANLIQGIRILDRALRSWRKKNVYVICRLGGSPWATFSRFSLHVLTLSRYITYLYLFIFIYIFFSPKT